MRRRSVALVVSALALSVVINPSRAAGPPDRVGVSWTRFVTQYGNQVSAGPLVAADRAGNVYLAGGLATPLTSSGGSFAAPATAPHPTSDLWVASYTSTGTLRWLRSFGDLGRAFPGDIEVLSDGRVAVAATVRSSAAFDGTAVGSSHPSATSDAVVAVLESADGSLAWSRYVKSSWDYDGAWGVAAAPQGGVVVTGATWPSDNPLSVYPHAGTLYSVGFVTLLSREGALRWTRAIAPTRSVTADQARAGMQDAVTVTGVDTDRVGRVVVTGFTSSPYLPTTRGVVQPRRVTGNTSQGFVAAFTPAGSVAWLTYLGAHGDVSPADIALGPGGTVTVAGGTTATDFPRLRPVQPRCTDGDGFMTRLAANGSKLLHSTCLGGTSADGISRVRINADGSTLLVGYSASRANFPQRRSLPWGGVLDAFVARISADGRLRTSSFLGGGGYDIAQGLAVLPAGDVLVSGYTESPSFPGAADGDAPIALADDGAATVRAAGFVTRLHRL